METLDRVFDLLSKERRRYALYYLEEQEGPVSVDEVAAQVADWENSDATGETIEKEIENVKMNLYHIDLPKASEATHIQYNRKEGTVELVEESPEFDAITSVAEIIERPSRNP